MSKITGKKLYNLFLEVYAIAAGEICGFFVTLFDQTS